MKSIVLASNNPVKRDAVLTGFLRMFPDEEFFINGITSPSGVSNQPLSSNETLQGALNRLEQAIRQPSGCRFLGGYRGRC
jgi:inosine/xanthosine triphosphatase